MNDASKLRENLLRYRTAAGLTQEGLAELAGLSAMAVIQIETGRRENPALQTMLKLSRALGITVNELAGIENYARKRVARTMALAGALPNFGASADFLSSLSRLSETRQRAVLAVVFESVEFVADNKQLSQAVAGLLKVC